MKIWKGWNDTDVLFAPLEGSPKFQLYNDVPVLELLKVTLPGIEHVNGVSMSKEAEANGFTKIESLLYVLLHPLVSVTTRLGTRITSEAEELL